MLIKKLNGVLNRLTWIPLLSFIFKWNIYASFYVLQMRCRILQFGVRIEDPECRPATCRWRGEDGPASLGKNDCDFMKFGGTETGTQGTLGHHLLYFPSKTTDRTSKASNSLNKYIKNTQHSFKLLEDSMSTRKPNCKDILVNWIHSLVQPLVVRKTLFVSIRMTLFSLYKHCVEMEASGGSGVIESHSSHPCPVRTGPRWLSAARQCLSSAGTPPPAWPANRPPSAASRSPPPSSP